MQHLMPEFDGTFSEELLREYLVHLVREGYMEHFEEGVDVDWELALDVFLMRCGRLKEPLFLLSELDGTYDMLARRLKEAGADLNASKKRIEKTAAEWEQLHEVLDGQVFSDELLESSLPYRYARLSQASKCWKFMKELDKWHQECDMMSSSQGQAPRTRGKRYYRDSNRKVHIVKNVVE